MSDAASNDALRPGSWGAWILASRPATLTAAVVPVLVGAACAYALRGFQWLPSLAALGVAIWVQIGTNLANDVFDYEKGADTGERLGPTRAVQAGLLSAAQVRRGMILAFAIAFAFGLYLTWVAGWPLLVVGIASILSGIAYTGGPFPLGYHGLGDLFVLIFFGFVAVCCTAYVSLGIIPALAVWLSLPVGCLATDILVVNNLRDRDGDAAAGKRTMAVRLGRHGAFAEYVVLLAIAYAVPVVLIARGETRWLLLPLATLPSAAFNTWRLWTDEGKALNATLVGTAQLLLKYGILVAAGLVLSTR